MVSIEPLVTGAPPFHEDAAGQPVYWALHRKVLHYIGEVSNHESRTLETGAGMSTVVFAAAGAAHITVVPDDKVVARIRQFCGEKGIPLDKVHFEIGTSESVLPSLPLGELDVVLIDGRHGFPAPFIDWHYTAGALKVGGVLIVDDIQLWTGRVLRDFLEEEPGWAVEREFPTTIAFRKTAAGSHAKEWNDQPFVSRQSLHIR
jgi:Methyltransferase domain